MQQHALVSLADTEDVADLAIEAYGHDPDVTRRLARLLVQHLAELLPGARPIGLNGLFKAVAKLALWAMAEEREEVAAILVTGIAGVASSLADDLHLGAGPRLSYSAA